MMDSKITLDFSQLDEFNQQCLRKVRSEYPNLAKRFIRKAGNEYRKDMRKGYKEGTKKRSGNLLRGVTRGKSFVYNGNEYQIRVYNKAPHAQFIEYGHGIKVHGKFIKKRVEGRHIVGKTANAFKSKFVTLAEEFVDEILEEGFK